MFGGDTRDRVGGIACMRGVCLSGEQGEKKLVMIKSPFQRLIRGAVLFVGL